MEKQIDLLLEQQELAECQLQNFLPFCFLITLYLSLALWLIYLRGMIIII